MKRWLRNLTTVCFLALFACFAAAPMGVSAYGLTQSNPAANSITVSWEAESDALAYHVYAGEDYATAPLVQDLPASSTSVTITGLKPGTEYYVSVKYDETSYSGGINTWSVGSDNFRTTPAKVANVHETEWYYFLKSFTVEWNTQTGADGYEYKITQGNGKKLVTKTEKSRYTHRLSYSKKVSNSMIYVVQVRSYAKICGKKYYGKWSNKCYCFTQPRIQYARVLGNKLAVKWGRVAGATGYEIYVSTKPKKGYKKVKTVGKNASSAIITKLKGKGFSSRQSYYVYVLTVKKVGKHKNTSGRVYYWNTKSSTDSLF